MQGQPGSGGPSRSPDAEAVPRDASAGATLKERISLRPVRSEDEPFLIGLLADVRREELDLLPWSEAEKNAFIRSQHAAQHAHYTSSRPNASFDLVLLDGVPAGRLYVQRDDEAIYLLEISLSAEHRGKGVGTALLDALFSEADARGVKVTAHVERTNRALGLYLRLGFRPVSERGLHLLIERPPL